MTVGLVLDTVTGLTSPQFHIMVDDHFDTINAANLNDEWLVRCGFKRSSSTQRG